MDYDAIVDSISLCDDGNHFDGQYGDGLFGCYLPPQSIESDFTLDIKITYVDYDDYNVEKDIARFTTIGPVVFDNYTILSTDTIPNPGDRLRLKITLKNNGISMHASNITAQLTSLDTTISISTTANVKYHDIPPDETRTSLYDYRINIIGDVTEQRDVPLALEIKSDGYSFWSDTFTVAVYPTPTQVESTDGIEMVPSKFSLSQNYPNPFNPTTTIRYELKQAEHVNLSVYDVLGREVKVLVDNDQTAGTYHLEFDADGLTNGVYFYHIKAGSFEKTCKMIILE